MGEPERNVNGPQVSEGTQRGAPDDGVRDRIVAAIRDLARARAEDGVSERNRQRRRWRAVASSRT